MVSAMSTTLLVGGMGCASLFSHGDKKAGKAGENRYSAGAPASSATLKDERIQSLESTVLSLNSRIQELEGKLQASANRPHIPDSVIRQTLDTPIRASVAASDPESGFANDQNTRAFQQGKILFDQEKYPEAILAFSAFLERSPNHTLASQAQYTIAESYYLESDYAVAEQEFKKLTLKYPRSPRTSYALVRLALCAEKLGKVNESKSYRAQVEGLYPRSPALKGLREAATPQQNSMQGSLIVVPPTAPVVDTPQVEIPHVEAPQIQAPQVQAPKLETQIIEAAPLGSDLDSPPGGGG